MDEEKVTIIDEWEGVVSHLLKNGDILVNMRRKAGNDGWLPSSLSRLDAGDKTPKVGDRFKAFLEYLDRPSGRVRTFRVEWP